MVLRAFQYSQPSNPGPDNAYAIKIRSNNFAGSNIPTQSFEGANVLSSNQNPSTPLNEKILGAAQTPTNLDGSTPPKLKREQILGGGGPSGPPLTPENIF